MPQWTSTTLGLVLSLAYEMISLQHMEIAVQAIGEMPGGGLLCLPRLLTLSPCLPLLLSPELWVTFLCSNSLHCNPCRPVCPRIAMPQWTLSLWEIVISLTGKGNHPMTLSWDITEFLCVSMEMGNIMASLDLYLSRTSPLFSVPHRISAQIPPGHSVSFPCFIFSRTHVTTWNCIIYLQGTVLSLYQM